MARVHHVYCLSLLAGRYESDPVRNFRQPLSFVYMVNANLLFTGTTDDKPLDDAEST